jgi:predicted dehydrogenase
LIKRILIVGLGSIGNRHLQIAKKLLPNADIRLLRHRKNMTYEISQYSNGSFYTIDEAIHFAPEIAIIANPAPFHIETAKIFAKIGTHLLIEKPLSSSIDGVKELLEICKKQNLVLFTGYNLRFFSSLQYFRDLLIKSVIGEIFSIRCEVGQYLPSWRPNLDYRQSVSAKEALGGGVLLELSHEIDYLNWIFGDIEWVKATLGQQSNLEIEVEDSAHLIFGFPIKKNGRQLIGTANLDFIRRDTTRTCLVIGDKGSLRWNGLTGEVQIFMSEEKKWKNLYKCKPQKDDSYIAEWENFIDCVTMKVKPLVAGEDGLKVLQIIKAAKLSAANCGKISFVENV